MPFDAAKAIAATFCWKIRYALVPLFNEDFVDLCTHPGDPAYKRFTIDPAITKICALEQRERAKANCRKGNGQQEYDVTSPSSPDLPLAKARKRPLRPRPSRSPSIVDYDMSDISNTTMISADEMITSRLESESYITPVSLGPTQDRLRRPPTSNPAGERRKRVNSQMNKRDYSDFDADVESSTSSSTRECAKRKKKSGMFTADEARAAYQLLSLRYGD